MSVSAVFDAACCLTSIATTYLTKSAMSGAVDDLVDVDDDDDDFDVDLSPSFSVDVDSDFDVSSVAEPATF